MMVGGGAIAVDLTDSRDHRQGHIPGSRFAIRANLPGNLDGMPDTSTIVLTSPDGMLAAVAAADAGAAERPVKVLRGGTAAWTAAGLPLATGLKDNLDDPVDVWYRPYDLDEGNEEAMKTYLGWEVDLTKQIERDGTTAFLDFGAAGTGGSG